MKAKASLGTVSSNRLCSCSRQRLGLLPVIPSRLTPPRSQLNVFAGDRPVEITLERTWAALKLWKRAALVVAWLPLLVVLPWLTLDIEGSKTEESLEDMRNFVERTCPEARRA